MSELPIRRKPPDGAHTRHEPNVRDRLRARREALARASTRLFVLPGYDQEDGPLGGQLVVRYRRLTLDGLMKPFEGVSKDDDVVGADAQFLIDACDEILIREADGSFTPLVEGHKTGFAVNPESGESLGTVLGLEHLPSVREQMVAALGGNELALTEHSGKVHNWMTAANDVDAEMALGEAVAR